jgi:hypothetical protein
MDARRRILLDTFKKQYAFLEGSHEITNSLSYSFNGADIGSYIAVNAPPVNISEGRATQGFGLFKIEMDFTKFKKLCIETEGGKHQNSESAVGYSLSYSGNIRAPRLPEVYQNVNVGSARTVIQFDISQIKGVRTIVGAVQKTGSTIIANYPEVFKVYNIWLE